MQLIKKHLESEVFRRMFNFNSKEKFNFGLHHHVSQN